MKIKTKNIIETKIVRLFDQTNPLTLDCGVSLSPIDVAYETYGELNSEGTNAIVVCHALTGSAHAAGYSSEDPKSIGWWDSFIGEGKPLDTKKYFIISIYQLSGYLQQYLGQDISAAHSGLLRDLPSLCSCGLLIH